jgi:hypothetical protein
VEHGRDNPLIHLPLAIPSRITDSSPGFAFRARSGFFARKIPVAVRGSTLLIWGSQTYFLMPIYEFFCPNNRRIYSFFARSLRYSEKTPRCPDNAKWKLEKMISGFAITGRAKEAQAGAEAGDDPKMDAAMEAMEREFGNMGDTDNPDPRALAKMMRRMGELTGQKMPAQMDEVIARLEKGEDPDKLEQEFGDVFDEMDGAFGGDDGAEGAGASGGKRSRRKKRITRDPTLYEMSDYCA